MQLHPQVNPSREYQTRQICGLIRTHDCPRAAHTSTPYAFTQPLADASTLAAACVAAANRLAPAARAERHRASHLGRHAAKCVGAPAVACDSRLSGARLRGTAAGASVERREPCAGAAGLTAAVPGFLGLWPSRRRCVSPCRFRALRCRQRVWLLGSVPFCVAAWFRLFLFAPWLKFLSPAGSALETRPAAGSCRRA